MDIELREIMTRRAEVGRAHQNVLTQNSRNRPARVAWYAYMVRHVAEQQHLPFLQICGEGEQA